MGYESQQGLEQTLVLARFHESIEQSLQSANATSFTGALDALGCLVASGRCDVGIIGAAQIDRYGNVNTTGIWRDRPAPDFSRPKHG